MSTTFLVYHDEISNKSVVEEAGIAWQLGIIIKQKGSRENSRVEPQSSPEEKVD